MARRLSRQARVCTIALVGAGVFAATLWGQIAPPAATSPRAFFDSYCITCHNQKLRTAGLALDALDVTNPGANAEVWERVTGKLRAGSMPPAGMPRPDAAAYRAVATSLESEIDRAWAAHPNTGKISPVHRLNRAEYQNAVRDLFALDFDVKPLLPGDERHARSFGVLLHHGRVGDSQLGKSP